MVSFAIMTTSCHSVLDLKPNSSIAPDNFYRTKDECKLALNSVYSDIASGDTYGFALSMYFDAGSDEALFNRSNVKWSPALYLLNSSTTDVEKTWMRLYKGINGANYFLKRVPSSQMTEEDKTVMMAEAHFLRALYYFDLVRLWGAVPLRVNPIENVGEANYIVKSKVSDIYKQIISDLEFASEHLLGPSVAIYGRATNTAANGLLTRVYLTKATHKEAAESSDYDNVIKYASMIEDNGYHKLLSNYKQIFLNQIQDKNDNIEMIFEIQLGNLRPQGIREDGRIGNLNGVKCQLVGDKPYAYAMLNASLGLVNSYDRVNDVRFDWNIAAWRVDKKERVIFTKKLVEASSYPGKFRRIDITKVINNDGSVAVDKYGKDIYTWVGLEKGPLEKSYTGINFPYLRYADVLLMKAEALNEIGKTGEAVPYLNMIRNRAGLADIDPGMVSSKEAFFLELVDERRRELCFEAVRKHDLIRWGRLKTNLDILENEMKAAKVPEKHLLYRQFSNFQEKHLLLPIPLKELTNNTMLTQTEGWQ